MAFTTLPADKGELESLRLQLIDYKLDVDRALSETKLAVMRASRRAAALHRYSDPKWFQNTQEMAATLGRESQRVQLLVGEVGRKVRQINGQTRTYPDAFVELAKILLPPGDFERISEAAHRVSNRSSSSPAPCSLTSTG